MFMDTGYCCSHPVVDYSKKIPLENQEPVDIFGGIPYRYTALSYHIVLLDHWQCGDYAIRHGYYGKFY